MTLAVYSRIRTSVEVPSDFSEDMIPAGTEGTIVECYSEPEEGYAVDLTISDPAHPDEPKFANVILKRRQFEIVDSAPSSGANP